jgi:vacuolar-type H+-ATPase subunit I/STV1
MELYQGRETRYEFNLIIFLRHNTNSTEKDFIDSRIEEENQRLVRCMAFSEEEVTKEIRKKNDGLKEFIKPNYEEFIKDKVEEKISGNKTGIRRLRKEIKFFQDKLKLIQLLEKEEYIDYCDEKDIDKVRFLIEMGLVDYLRDNHFEHSVSSLATALTSVTGIKHNTLKGYLNAYLSTPDNRQNPMKDSKKVGVIQMKLKAIGFKKQ